MRYTLVVLALLGLVVTCSACASSQDTDEPPPRENSTPPQDQENLRNIQRQRPN